jgi:hypothetical protein
LDKNRTKIVKSFRRKKYFQLVISFQLSVVSC